MRPPVGLVLVSAISSVARESLSAGLLLDLPDAVVVRHDLITRADDGLVRRVVADRDGIVSSDETPLEHACLSCTVREDLVPTIQRLVDDGRWSTIVLALPVAATTDHVAWALDEALRTGDIVGARLGAVMSVVELDALTDDLLGDDLLVERELHLGEHDRRSVGETLASQIEYADVVVTLDECGEEHLSERTLLEQLVGPDAQLWFGWQAVPAQVAVEHRHDLAAGRRRIDPLRRRVDQPVAENGVWTIALESTRPLHPGRLLDRLEDLGSGPLRARGVFWVPSRPLTCCVWDGAGGQLSIGEYGLWRAGARATRLTITGVRSSDRARVQEAFDDVLLTPDEWSAGLSRWQGAPDGLEPWLGEGEGEDDEASTA